MWEVEVELEVFLDVLEVALETAFVEVVSVEAEVETTATWVEALGTELVAGADDTSTSELTVVQ